MIRRSSEASPCEVSRPRDPTWRTARAPDLPNVLAAKTVRPSAAERRPSDLLRLSESPWRSGGVIRFRARSDEMPGQARTIGWRGSPGRSNLLPDVHRDSYGRSGLLDGPRDVLALVTPLLLLLGSTTTAGAKPARVRHAGIHRAPGIQTPARPRVVEVWNEELPGAWDPPACTGWTARDDGMIVALAGCFRHDGDVEDLLRRFGAISALTEIRYWSVIDKACG
jgi:hypothetical protein